MNVENHAGQFISVNSVTLEVVLHCWKLCSSWFMSENWDQSCVQNGK